MHLTFSIPRGNDGASGSSGEVSNTNGVSTLDSSFADLDMEALRLKVKELILNGRR